MTATAIDQAPAADEEREEQRRPQWELAECTCPDFCERDHELD